MKKTHFTTYTAIVIQSSIIVFLEILLTRVFSAIMYYHFSFLIVSMAMFGLSIGAIIASQSETKHYPILATQFSLLQMLSLVLFLFLLYNFRFNHTTDFNWLIIISYFTASTLMFVFSGAILSILVTSAKKLIDKLYATDLIGAATGGIAVLIGINFLGIFYSFILIVVLNYFLTILFKNGYKKRYRKGRIEFMALLPILLVVGFYHLSNPTLSSIKNSEDKNSKLVYEKWNIISHVTVRESEDSCCFQSGQSVEHMNLLIDSDALTPIFKFDSLEDLQFLKSDITNLGYHINPSGDSLIIGAGGGKDILSALVFGQNKIVALEINPIITNLLRGKFASYTGNIATNPRVQLITTEARAWIESSRDQFDIIQISLIDTWAASSAGAYSLTENSLYTTEAVCSYLDRLRPNGVISVSRWYHNSAPGEIYRTITLFKNGANKCQGIQDISKKIVIINKPINSQGFGLTTILFSKDEMSKQTIETLAKVVDNNNFESLYLYSKQKNRDVEKVVNSKDIQELSKVNNINLSPPTDDTPFFFNMVKPSQILSNVASFQGYNSKNTIGSKILVLSSVFSLCLSLFLLILPTVINKERKFTMNKSLVAYFAFIGLGFMLIEISLIQRFSIFLSQPGLSLSIVVSTILLSAGIGSFYSQKIKNIKYKYLIMLSIILLTGYIKPTSIEFLQKTTTINKALASVLLLTPVAFCLGYFFPTGISQIKSKDYSQAALWIWGINGAFSILGSNLAVLISLNNSITTAYLSGVVCYLAAIFFLNKKTPS